MPSADAVLLPLCAGLTLLGVLMVLLAGRRRSPGRVMQGIGLALLPIALYLSGLLRLLWDGGVALVRWATNVVMSPPIWAGLSILALCLVLWVVGGVIARRSPGRRRSRSRGGETDTSASPRAVAPSQPGTAQRGTAQPAPPVDDDMAEIEALLKARGID